MPFWIWIRWGLTSAGSLSKVVPRNTLHSKSLQRKSICEYALETHLLWRWHKESRDNRCMISLNIVLSAITAHVLGFLHIQFSLCISSSELWSRRTDISVQLSTSTTNTKRRTILVKHWIWLSRPFVSRSETLLTVTFWRKLAKLLNTI